MRLGLAQYDGIDKIRLDMSHVMLEKLIFLQEEEGRKTFAFDFNLIKKIDLSGVSFDDVSVEYVDFTGSKGETAINPQTVFLGSLVGTTLSDVKLKECDYEYNDIIHKELIKKLLGIDK